MKIVSRRALAEQAARIDRLRNRAERAENALRTAEVNALRHAGDAIEAAIQRTLSEYPDEPAMSVRVLGMRAAQRIVAGDLTEDIGPVAAACRCDESDADPYQCEADDCTGYFSELNPFGGSRPVNERSTEVSRVCPVCGWKTSVWHVDDGSAEAELYSHVARRHGGSYEKASTPR